MSVEIATKDDLRELFESQTQQFRELSLGLIQEISSRIKSTKTEDHSLDTILWKRDIIHILGISPRTFDNVIVKLPFIMQSKTLKRNQWYCRKSDLDKYIKENKAI